MSKRKKQKWIALSLTTLIFFSFLAGFVFLNRLPGDSKKKPKTVQFETKKLKPKQRKLVQKRAKEKPKQKEVAKKRLRPDLSLLSQSSNFDFGLDIAALDSNSTLLETGNGPLTQDVVDSPPEVQFREPITLPEEAREKNIEGHVVLNILVDEQGKVGKVKLIESNPTGVFEQIAMQSVRTWRFSPAYLAQKAVPVWVQQKISFRNN